MALGAQAKDVIRLILSQGSILILSGLVIGLFGAFFSDAIYDQFAHRSQRDRSDNVCNGRRFDGRCNIDDMSDSCRQGDQARPPKGVKGRLKKAAN